MTFEKGHNVKGGGRKKGTKNGEGKNPNTSMNAHNYSSKKWSKSSSKRTFDIDEVDYYIYNDLDIIELMDKKKLPAYEWQGGNKMYNLNSQAKKKKEENGE
jgi:hypothetical protein